MIRDDEEFSIEVRIEFSTTSNILSILIRYVTFFRNFDGRGAIVTRVDSDEFAIITSELRSKKT